MTDQNKTAEFYARLKEQLMQDTNWPAPYLFKFIVPKDATKVLAIAQIFSAIKAEIKTRDSAKGTYTSVSIAVIMESPDAVIKKYLEVSNIEGVISL